ncbi:MAG: Mur ligase family protein [Pseudomonadota bacterium]
MWLPHWPLPQWHSDFELGNKILLEVAEQLGNPQNKLPPVIHVAGTNGKGSVIAFVEAILKANNLTCHRFTSPHLKCFNERFIISGNMLSDDKITFYLEKIRLVCEKLSHNISLHAAATVAFILAASEYKADYVLLETGMGGRLDATNIIESHEVSIITPISFDHTLQLGDEIPQIAYEKAGIIKPSRPCIIGPQLPEAEAVLRFQAKKKKAPVICYGNNFGITTHETKDDWFIYHSDNIMLELPSPALIGRHQYLNAATAIAACEAISTKFCNKSKVKTAMDKVSWPGRLQQVTKKYKKYLPKNSDFYIDGAHNITGAGIMADWLELLEDDREKVLMIGLTYGKNISEFLEPFKNIVSKIIAVNVPREAKSYAANQIGVIALEMGFDARVADNHIGGLELAKNFAKPIVLLACGSLYLTAEFIG